jgi:hypothetical protein
MNVLNLHSWEKVAIEWDWSDMYQFCMENRYIKELLPSPPWSHTKDEAKMVHIAITSKRVCA